MRSRIALGAAALAVAAAFVAAPIAMASGNPAPSTEAKQPAPISATTAPPAPSVGKDGRVVVPPTPSAPGQVRERPKGAAETGEGGVEAGTSVNPGVIALGGAAVLLVGGAGVLGYRRMRRSN